MGLVGLAVMKLNMAAALALRVSSATQLSHESHEMNPRGARICLQRRPREPFRTNPFADGNYSNHTVRTTVLAINPDTNSSVAWLQFDCKCLCSRSTS